jgi:ribonucleotide reductase beta subunit family protein with ferritin-like domain
MGRYLEVRQEKMDDLLEQVAELKIKYGKEVFARIRLKVENKKLKDFVEYVADEDNFEIGYHGLSNNGYYKHDDICVRAQECLEELKK